MSLSPGKELAASTPFHVKQWRHTWSTWREEQHPNRRESQKAQRGDQAELASQQPDESGQDQFEWHEQPHNGERQSGAPRQASVDSRLRHRIPARRSQPNRDERNRRQPERLRQEQSDDARQGKQRQPGQQLDADPLVVNVTRKHTLEHQQPSHAADHAERQNQAGDANRRVQVVVKQQPGEAEKDLIHHRRHEEDAQPTEQQPITERRPNRLP